MKFMHIGANSMQSQFILDCVYNNSVVPNYSKFGVQQNLTVQELLNSNIETLIKIGQGIRKLIDNDASEFSSKAKPLEIGGLKADRWIDFIKYTIIIKEKDLDEKILREEIEKTQLLLEGVKTPAEKKKKLREKLDSLNNSLHSIK